MAKSKRALADEAWVRVNTPDNNGALPGQLDLVALIERGELPVPAPAMPVGDIGNDCPNCGKTLSILHGWAYSREAPWTLQCPNCAKRFEVSEEKHHLYRDLVRATYAALPSPPPKKKTVRPPRGAR